MVIGHSVRHRAIVATAGGDPAARTRILVIGCIHGDEPAGIAIARRLQHAHPPAGVVVWSITVVNPDGVAADTRQNAHRVDLNRNFPWRWRPIGRPGDQQYSGSHALSEPESRATAAFIRRTDPAVTIWFRQPLGLVDESGGNIAIERRYARLVHLPLRRLTRYPGSAAGWQDAVLPTTTAFVVELPAGRLSTRDVTRYAQGVLRLGASFRAASRSPR